MKTANCTDACYAMPRCLVCGKTKHPVGRSVAAEAANGYCDDDCKGYRQEPLPGHLWPEEWEQGSGGEV